MHKRISSLYYSPVVVLENRGIKNNSISTIIEKIHYRKDLQKRKKHKFQIHRKHINSLCVIFSKEKKKKKRLTEKPDREKGLIKKKEEEKGQTSGRKWNGGMITLVYSIRDQKESDTSASSRFPSLRDSV